MQNYVKDEMYDPGINLLEDEPLNNKIDYLSDGSDCDCMRIVNDTGPEEMGGEMSGAQRSGGPQTGRVCDHGGCGMKTCPYKPYTCEDVFCDTHYDRNAKKCPLCQSPRRTKQMKGKCDAVYTVENDDSDHEEGDQVDLYEPTGVYECHLSKSNSKGYRFCKYCSTLDVCPICGENEDKTRTRK